MTHDLLALREMFGDCPACAADRHADCDGWLFWCACWHPDCLGPPPERT